MPDIHMTPAEGMRAHLDLQGGGPHGVMLPIHWGTFNLAPHPWAEPGEGTVAAAADADQRVALPRPGEPFEPGAAQLPDTPWWRAVAHVPAGGWDAPGGTDGTDGQGGRGRETDANANANSEVADVSDERRTGTGRSAPEAAHTP